MYKILHKIEPGQRLKVAAYARVSNDKELLEASLNEQIDFYTRLIIKNQNWDYSGIYFDDGISGTTIHKRKGFKEMIDNAKAGLIDVIFVKSISRFARNVINLLELVRDFRKQGIEIFFEQQNISSLDLKCDQMITLYGEYAEEEAISVSRNQKWRFDADKRNGRYHIHTSHMMGYKYDEKGNVIIVEEEAKIIRLIYSLYLNDDMGTTQIAEFLKRNDIKDRKGSSNWGVSRINYILHNEKYVGDCLIQKTYREDPLTKKKKYNRGEQDKVLVSNGHPAIIEREIWNAVQNKMRSLCEKYKIKSYEKDDEAAKRVRYEFVDFIKCPYCGNNYAIKTNHYVGKTTNKFIVCRSNRASKLCKGDNYPLDVFKLMLAKQLKILKSNIPSLKEALNIEFEKNKENINLEELDDLNGQIESLRSKYNEIKERHDDFFKSLQEETVTRINELIVKRNEIQNKIVYQEGFKERVKTLVDNIKTSPDEIDDFNVLNFRAIFSKAIVVSKDLIYFVIGDKDLKSPPLKPKLYFKSSNEYKVRKTKFTTQFGIFINI